jgi:negative regulator of sigma E activity
MKARTVHQAVSLALSLVVTVAMLGGIDQLAQPEAPQAQWVPLAQGGQPVPAVAPSQAS